MAEFTGERVVPGQVDPDLLNEHLARYAFAARLCRHKRVLDMGCGMGYGTAELAGQALSATGIDVAATAVESASAQFRAANLRYLQASCTQLPFGDASFDLVVSFEVIEHIPDWRQMLSEARRVLRPGGQFIVSTPNKLYYAEARATSGPNPFHDHEFEFEEFRQVLEELFPSVSMFLQNHAAGIVFQPLQPDSSADVSIAGYSTAPEESHFFLAVCALGRQLGAPTFVYLPTTANLLRERELHIARLEKELATKNEWLDEARQEHKLLVEQFRAQTAEIQQKNQWAEDLNAQLKERGERVEQLQGELVTLDEGYKSEIARISEESRKLSEWAQETERALNAQLTITVRELEAKCNELALCVEILHETEKLAEERTLWAQSMQGELERLKAQLNFARSSRWLKLGRALHFGPDIQEQ